MARFVVYRNGTGASAGGNFLRYAGWPAAPIRSAEESLRDLLLTSPGAMFDATNRSTVLAGTSPPEPVESSGDRVARWLDLGSNADHANQADPGTRPVVLFDPPRIQGHGDERLLVVLDPAMADGEAWIDTPWGHFASPASGGAYWLPIGGTRRAFLREGRLTEQQAATFADWAGSDRAYLVATNPGTVVSGMACAEVDGGTPVLFIGANGVETTKLVPYSGTLTVDLAEDGLTAPMAVVWPASLIGHATIRSLRMPNCGFEGALPDLSGHPVLESVDVSGNRFAGSIPNLSANAGMVEFRCSGNLLSGFAGSIPSSLLTFDASDNLLNESTVDAILVAFAAAGSAGGYLALDGGGNSLPSGTGQAAVAELAARGWTVLVAGV